MLLQPEDEEQAEAEVPCFKCNGSKVNNSGLPCRKCAGTGSVRSDEYA
jgi:DnaJ-class molecular chaperone